MSQFFGLNTAYTGLMAANVGINTTGQNIANKDTKGYSRQIVNQQAEDAMRTFSRYGCAGAGVDVISVERIRNEFYDVKYWNNNANVGEYEVKNSYMKQVEDYFKDDDVNKGFLTIFNQMHDALQGIKNEADDDIKKSVFLGTAGNLANYFNGMSGNLEKLQKDANAEIKINADAINTYASQIASLTQQINVLEIRGDKANELRDQRDLIVDKLSLIVETKVEETPIYNDAMGGYTGLNRYEVTIAGGQSLVDTDTYNTLVCKARTKDEKVNQSDADGLYDIYWGKEGADFNVKTATKFNLNPNGLGGNLKALVEMRDGNNGENFQGTIAGIGKNSVTINVTESYLKDINKLNLPDTGGIINLDNQEFYYESWECKYDETTGQYSYTFELSGSDKNPKPLSPSKVGRDATVGSSVEYKGIPYYTQQMNEWIRTYATKVNEIISKGVDTDGELAGKLFVANDSITGEQLTFEHNTTTGFSSSSNSYYKLTAKNFGISNIMKDNPNKFPTHTDAGAGDSKYDIIDSLIDLKDNKDMMSFRGASAGEFLECISTDIFMAASSATLFQQNYTNMSKTIETQRLSLSGVSENEEAVNLTKFQHSYTLASKMIQTLTEIYDQLILNTGV